MENKEISYYVGIVSKVVNDSEFSKEYHVIEADIPGVADGIRAFPKQGETDEPRVGDQVLLACLDPLFSSYFIYSKLKEDNFIGLRASGKMIDVTPGAITLAAYKDESENTHEKAKPENFLSNIVLDKNGNIDISAAKDITIHADNITIDASTITMNGGGHDGLVSVGVLKMFLKAIAADLITAKSGTLTNQLLSMLDFLSNENIKH